MSDEHGLVCGDARALLTVAARLMRARVSGEGGVMLSHHFIGSLPGTRHRGRYNLRRMHAVWRWPGVVEVYAPQMAVQQFGRCSPIAESHAGAPLEAADPEAGEDITTLLAKADEALRKLVYAGFSHSLTFAASDVAGAPPWHYECAFQYPGVMTVHQGGRTGLVAAVSLPGRPAEPDADALQDLRKQR